MRCPKCSLILAEYYTLCPECQADLKEWHQLLGPFYKPSPEIYEGLFTWEEEEEKDTQEEMFYPTEKLLEEERASLQEEREAPNLSLVSPADRKASVPETEQDTLDLPEGEIDFRQGPEKDKRSPSPPEDLKRAVAEDTEEWEDEFLELKDLEDLEDLEELFPEEFGEGKST